MRLSVVIPCLDEAKTIAVVVREAQEGLAACGERLSWSEVVVSDNGSTDGSRDLAAAAGARIVDCPVRGYGAALHWGVLHAEGEYVVFGDADRAHDFGLLVEFVRSVEEHGPVDLVLASRLSGEIQEGAMSGLNRYLGTPVLNLAIWLLFGLRTSDCNSGQRMVRRAFYDTLNMRGPGMEYASELLIKTAIRKGRFLEFPGRVRPDERGRPPHMRRWRDGWRHLTMIVTLSPNRPALVAIAALLVVAFLFHEADARVAVAGVLWTAHAVLLVTLLAKLALHVTDVRPSRVIRRALRLPFVLGGLVVAGAVTLYGTHALVTSPSEAVRDIALCWLTAGLLTGLSMGLWEVLRAQLTDGLPLRPPPVARTP